MTAVHISAFEFMSNTGGYPARRNHLHRVYDPSDRYPVSAIPQIIAPGLEMDLGRLCICLNCLPAHMCMALLSEIGGSRISLVLIVCPVPFTRLFSQPR
jgi:hypothetical protein